MFRRIPCSVIQMLMLLFFASFWKKISALFNEKQCLDRGGECINTKTCFDWGGHTILDGLCPNQPDSIKCCIFTSEACAMKGGQCFYLGNCDLNSHLVPDLCAREQYRFCCVPFDINQACQNQEGHCIEEDICPNNGSEIVQGLCPGRPSNIQCCIPKRPPPSQPWPIRALMFMVYGPGVMFLIMVIILVALIVTIWRNKERLFGHHHSAQIHVNGQNSRGVIFHLSRLLNFHQEEVTDNQPQQQLQSHLSEFQQIQQQQENHPMELGDGLLNQNDEDQQEVPIVEDI